MSLLEAKAPDGSSRGEPLVDFVLKFQAIPPKYVSGKKRVPEALAQERAKEYAALIATIRAQRLQVTSRVDPDHTGHVLIFVSAPDRLLAELREKERVRDFLSGVIAVQGLAYTPSRDTMGAVRTGDGQVISPADRLRYVHTLLTAATRAPEDCQNGELGGAALAARSNSSPHLVDMMPLHDTAFNAQWIKSWSNVSLRSIMMGIRDEEIDTLRFHFGENVAFYFAFLNTYYTSLAPAAMLGLIFWLSGAAYSPMYSVMLVLWTCVFVEVWRQREFNLAVRWGALGVRKVHALRPEFKPRAVVADPVTGEKLHVFEWWRRELRMFASLPVVLLFVVLLIVVLTTIFFVEVIAAEVYDGPGKNIVPFIPTVLFSICVPAIQSAWQATATFLTGWENHATERSFSSSLTLKIFGLQSLVTYGGLVLTAYVYIPFGKYLVELLFEHGYLARVFQIVSRQPNFQMPSKLDFQVHPDRLYNQLFALCATGQVTNTVTELLVPIVLRTLMHWKDVLAQRFSKTPDTNKAQHRVSFASDRAERSFLQRVQSEFSLPTYDVFVDYAEMATQLGNIALWSTIWPLAPVLGYVNNWFELRSDAYKIIVNMRRPVPMRIQTIGSWLEVFSFLVRLAVFTNASLVYLFEDRVEGTGASRVVHTVMRSHLHPAPTGKIASRVAGMLPHFLPRSSAGGALAASFLFALLCDQVFTIVWRFVRHVLKRLLWDDSEEERALRRVQHENRVSLVERLKRTEDLDSALQTSPLSASQRVHPDQSFWDAAHDAGMSYITSAAKTA